MCLLGSELTEEYMFSVEVKPSSVLLCPCVADFVILLFDPDGVGGICRVSERRERPLFIIAG